jgi:hypothetical protein
MNSKYIFLVQGILEKLFSQTLAKHGLTDQIFYIEDYPFMIGYNHKNPKHRNALLEYKYIVDQLGRKALHYYVDACLEYQLYPNSQLQLFQ